VGSGHEADAGEQMSTPSSSVIEQLTKSSRRAGIASLLGVALVFVALIYSAIHLRSLKMQIDAAKNDLTARQAQLAKLDDEIRSKQLQVNVLNQVVATVASENSAATKQAYQSALQSNQGAAQVLPRVYFQLRTKAQMPRAKVVADALIAKGFSIPEFEIMYPHGTVRTFLRHFQNGPIVDQDLARIMEVLKQLDVKVEEQDFSDSKNDPSTKDFRNYELWFGPEF
jgi:cell division protein FtsB